MDKKTTPDERFLIALYQKQTKTPGPFDYLKIANEIGLKETAAKNIVKDLAQANFIRKRGDRLIDLTDHGKTVAQNLLS